MDRPRILLNPLLLNKLRLLIVVFALLACRVAGSDRVVVGAERTDRYLPLIEGKRVGILTNHTGRIGRTHIVDSLYALGVDLKMVFAPEHGFRGDADAGEHVSDGRDAHGDPDRFGLRGQ